MRNTRFYTMIGLVCLVMIAVALASGCTSTPRAPVDNTGPRADMLEKTMPLREY